MSFLSELIKFLLARKKYWIIPTFILLLILGGLMVVGQSSIAPLIYTIF